MEARAQISGVRGVVADLIDVPKEYETAVETALGGSIQNIVTDTEQTAKRLIEYLKKNRYGRATFLPLNAVSGREEGFSSQILSEPGVLGRLPAWCMPRRNIKAWSAIFWAVFWWWIMWITPSPSRGNTAIRCGW